MPVQERAIPPALEGHDLIAIAQTGTGKTLAFGLAGLTRLAADENPRAQMLVLCPTRELAVQIHDVLRPLARELRLRTACVYGGVGMGAQVSELSRHPSVIVATPGRLLDHIARRGVSFTHLKMLVLDEADRMLDMGFLPDIKRILAVLPALRQTLLFSATFPEDIRQRVLPMLRSPKQVEVTPASTPVELIEQNVYTVSQTEKANLLTRILSRPEVNSTLVFTRTKYRADRVAKMLRGSGFNADAIHGDRSQNQRQDAIDRFRSGASSILVATDIAARGIDVKGITHVINYDIPIASEDYIHRIGRTARAQTTGIALTFASPGDESALRAIEKTVGRRIVQLMWEGAVKLSEHGSSAPAARPGSRPGQGFQRGSRDRDSSGGNRGGREQGHSSRSSAHSSGSRAGRDYPATHATTTHGNRPPRAQSKSSGGRGRVGPE